MHPFLRRVAVAGCATVVAASAGLVACGKSAPASKTIGVTLLTREDEFYRQLEAGLKEAATAHGYALIVTSGDRDLAKQQSQIDNFIVQKVSAIIVCPVDSKGIGPAIERANAAQIPVFTADIAADGGKVIAHVASDNLAGGQLAAEYVAKAIGDKGEVGIVTETDVQSTIDREKGFRDALAKHPGVKLVSAIDGAGRRDRSLKAADDMLQAHPGIRGIFAINDESALGVLSSVQSRRGAKPVIVGYDADDEAQKSIAGGTALKADVAQQPRVIGQRTIDAIADHFAGHELAPRIAVPVRIVDADSVRAMAGPAKP
jgi:ribose transport system substrate-binding protein